MISLPSFTLKTILIIAGSIILLVLFTGAGFIGYRYWKRQDPDAALKAREAVFQKQIDSLLKQNESLEADLKNAKAESARAYQRAQVAARSAEQWLAKYRTVLTERENLKRAQSGGEAVRELRKMGWVK